ncbi:hypothetical protein [Streptomyces caniscabiei]|uniref:Secreted protein n=1 Tax=Streptomyces caniscabiei TaxID=2746961 RepID=A0ABU4MIH4_9ACTN|nr:hypothetical protein [Streptomyces caniscabiei]MBE4790996.1 hypothetical protein [Streptomyces caniscabiei]MDX3009625.1 hypothetical protein [Streptomyces caniscabiei]MDX3037270.1 hypothetical protein [Streptomyces caniscabiei]
MTGAAGLLLAIVCITVVGLALGLAIACWDDHTPTWAPRLIRGTAVTIGALCLFLAALQPIAQALP